MIAALLAKIGLEAGMKTGGRLLGIIVIAGLFAGAGVSFWRGMVAIERMVETARVEATVAAVAACDAAREAANAAAEAARARQALAAADASARAEATISSLTKSLTEWETRNASRADAGQTCLGPDDLAELERLRARSR